MVRIAPGDEEPGESLGKAVSTGFGAMAVQVSQCFSNAAAVVDISCELNRGSPRLVILERDALTLLTFCSLVNRAQ
jgi:hypothetical protein